MSDTNEKSGVNPIIILIFGAVCIGFAPIFVKLIGNDRLGPTAIGFWRTLFGASTLFIISAFRGVKPLLTKRLYLFAVLAGFIFFVDLFVWHRSIMYCGAGMSTILGNTQVFGTALLARLIFKEKMTLRFIISAIAALGGVVLLVGIYSDGVIFNDLYLLGIAFGLATGIIYAHYLITLKSAGRYEPIKDVVSFMAWVSLFAAIFLGLSASVEPDPLMPPDFESLGLLVALGIVAQALGWWSITGSLAKIEASRAGLILLLQPTLAMILGVLIFSEQFTLSQVLGAVITLAAIYTGSLKK